MRSCRGPSVMTQSWPCRSTAARSHRCVCTITPLGRARGARGVHHIGQALAIGIGHSRAPHRAAGPIGREILMRQDRHAQPPSSASKPAQNKGLIPVSSVRIWSHADPQGRLSGQRAHSPHRPSAHRQKRQRPVSRPDARAVNRHQITRRDARAPPTNRRASIIRPRIQRGVTPSRSVAKPTALYGPRHAAPPDRGKERGQILHTRPTRLQKRACTGRAAPNNKLGRGERAQGSAIILTDPFQECW